VKVLLCLYQFNMSENLCFVFNVRCWVILLRIVRSFRRIFPIKIVKKMPIEVPIVQQQLIEVLNNNVQHDKNNIETDELDQEPDAFDRGSLNLIQEHDRAIDDEVVTTILQDSTHGHVLALHNSFNLLEDDFEQPAAEAGLVVSHKITELQDTFVDNVETATKGDVNLIRINTLETPSELKKGNLRVWFWIQVRM